MTKLSKTMQEEYEKMVGEFEKAQNAGSFEAWYAGSEEAYAEKVAAMLPRRRRIHIIFASRRREVYEDACNGIVETGAGYGTLKALERRGIIEVLPSVNGNHRVKLLTV